MPLYMAEFGYTPELWAGLIKSPENREESVRGILEEAGCKLHNIWYAFGGSDGFALIEAPDNITAAGISLTITASGAFPAPSAPEPHPAIATAPTRAPATWRRPVTGRWSPRCRRTSSPSRLRPRTRPARTSR